MSEIPEDVMKLAHKFAKERQEEWMWEFSDTRADFARAIMAERERCAAHCEKIGYPDIAYDLRNPKP